MAGVVSICDAWVEGPVGGEEKVYCPNVKVHMERIRIYLSRPGNTDGWVSQLVLVMVLHGQ